MTTGYSGTPLAKKLGIKAGMTIVPLNEPDDYYKLLGTLPERVTITGEPRNGADMMHVFTNSRSEMLACLAHGRTAIRQDGAIWISWYKKAAKLPTEITEDSVRAAALQLGLVDVKVCAIDEKWSALKLVIRKENRV